MRIPEGTGITVALDHELSSASAHKNDGFTATVAEPILVNGETVIPAGASVAGRVLDANRADSARDPGYLRVTLTTLHINGNELRISTSSLFAKASSRDTNNLTPVGRTLPFRDLVFASGRHLTFRLAEKVDLQEP